MSRSGSAYPTPDVISYTYNDRSELTGAQSNVDATYSYSYAYDPIGNRITANEAGVPWTYATNSLNQYTSATENNVQLNFSYDLDGGMTYRPVDATSGWTQVWDGENRMAETIKGTDRLTFKYDYMGRRVEKCVYSGNTLASRTLFVYDGIKCVEELDALDGNTVTMRHAWQPFDVGLDIILATTDGNGTSCFLHDANKNVMQRTVLNQAIRESYFYNPFGRSIRMQQNTAFCFSSEINDLESKLVYYNYRHYDANFGRWLSRDPISEIESLLLYGLLMNDPTNYYDINGLLRFRWYGQWGGPGWAMGRWVNDGWSDPNNPNYLQPPSNTNGKDYKDALDACYKEHDFCYERCRNNTKCPNDFPTCFSQCDYDSITCQLKALFTKGDVLMYPAAILGTIGLGSQGIGRDVITIIVDIPLPPPPQIIYTPLTPHDLGFIRIGWKWEF